MIVANILMQGVMLFALPLLIGSIYLNNEKESYGLVENWIRGIITMLAVFYVIATPFILMQKKFTLVCEVYSAVLGFVVFVVVFLLIYRRKTGGLFRKHEFKDLQTDEKIAFFIFMFLLGFQIYKAFALSYADGDDAFYVAITTITEKSDTMYTILPYTGFTSKQNSRYALAPLPIWIAYLARVTGIHVTTMSLLAIPPVFILTAYGVYWLISKQLFKNNMLHRILFMIFMELLYIFGDYSFFTIEHFLLTRSRQGKALLCNLVIPFLILLILRLFEALDKQEKIKFSYWTVLTSTLIAACLCSSLGVFLSAMFVGVAGIWGAICFKKVKFLIPLYACLLPCVVVAMIYIKM